MHWLIRSLTLSLIIILCLSSIAFSLNIPIKVTNTGGSHPSVSPDGEWVVFRSPDSGLAKIRSDGTDYTQLTQMIECYEPDWARHNENLILFRHNDSSLGSALLIINAFTFDTTFAFGGEFDDDPTWAPDGSAFAIQNASPDGIRIISYPDTSNVNDVTCTVSGGGDCDGEGPSWSPNSDWIAFEQGLKILKVQATGGIADVVVEGYGDVTSAAWSPDGKWIAFCLDSGSYIPNPSEPWNEFYIDHVWIADYRGTGHGLYKVTGGLFSDRTPAWSPNSDTIYFVRSDGDQYDIWKVEAFEPLSIEIDNSNPLPNKFSLDQNYPNPFNNITNIRFEIPFKEKVSLKIYNVLGKEVKLLIDNELSSGTYHVTWDGTDNKGQTVSSGVYFYKFSSESFIKERKMVLVK